MEQIKPLLIGLVASVGLLLFLVFGWPYVFPPSPVPFVEKLMLDVRAQNYEAVYGQLSERWRRQKTLREYVAENLKDEESFLRLGGFVEATHVDAGKISASGSETYVPVLYRVKIVGSTPPRTYSRRVILKLVLARGRWWLDGLKVFKE
jgi:hypothetical protein